MVQQQTDFNNLPFILIHHYLLFTFLINDAADVFFSKSWNLLALFFSERARSCSLPLSLLPHPPFLPSSQHWKVSVHLLECLNIKHSWAVLYALICKCLGKLVLFPSELRNDITAEIKFLQFFFHIWLTTVHIQKYILCNDVYLCKAVELRVLQHWKCAKPVFKKQKTKKQTNQKKPLFTA